jgi:hypothetical protein
MRDQPWRYYPQMLELADDLGAHWMLALSELVPTHEKAARVRDTTIARLLKKHRVSRFDAAHVLSELRKPALAVAQGTIEAATAYIRVAIEQLRFIDRQITDAERQIDRLCENLNEPVAGEDGVSAAREQQEQRDVANLDSLPGVVRMPWYGPVCPVVWEGRSRGGPPLSRSITLLNRAAKACAT